MNREIKFRAWDLQLKKMSKPFSFGHVLNFTDENGQGHIMSYDNKRHVAMQYLDLVDKNNNRACVGNIYQSVSLHGRTFLYKIFKVKGGFAVNRHQDDFYKQSEGIAFYEGLSEMQTASWFEGNLEHVGNIYESPLVKG